MQGVWNPSSEKSIGVQMQGNSLNINTQNNTPQGVHPSLGDFNDNIINIQVIITNLLEVPKSWKQFLKKQLMSAVQFCWKGLLLMFSFDKTLQYI